MKENYCEFCGSKLESLPTKFYNRETGEKIHEMFCMNVKCKVGCKNNGGHQFKIFSFSCKRCHTFFDGSYD